MNKTRLLGVVSAGMFAIVPLISNASSVVVDFEGAIPAGDSGIGDVLPYLERDFLISNIDSPVNAILSPSVSGRNTNGTDVFTWFGYHSIKIESNSGALFSILSFEGTNSSYTAGSSNDHFFVWGDGYGQNVSTAFDVTANTFSTFTFDSSWSGLSSVEIYYSGGAGPAIDNISLSTSIVPLPAALWFFGTGLLGLVGVARKRA